MRVFGAAAYRDMMALPVRAIARFAEIQSERDAAQQLTRLRLMATADGMEQGREYVPGRDDPKPKPGAGHYSLKRYVELVESLERRAEPWAADARQAQRRAAEERERWAKLKAAMGVGV